MNELQEAYADGAKFSREAISQWAEARARYLRAVDDTERGNAVITELGALQAYIRELEASAKRAERQVEETPCSPGTK